MRKTPVAEAAGKGTYLDTEFLKVYPWGMHKYLYIVSTDKPFTETELSDIKDEICRLFDCTEIAAAGGTRFTIHSPLSPDKVDSVVKELSDKFHAQFAAGGKLN